MDKIFMDCRNAAWYYTAGQNFQGQNFRQNTKFAKSTKIFNLENLSYNYDNM